MSRTDGGKCGRETDDEDEDEGEEGIGRSESGDW